MTDYKLFTTLGEEYSWTLPSNWEQYEEEGSYAFFNTTSWTGNLRITPMVLQERSGVQKSNVSRYIEDEISENKHAVKIDLGEYECAFYKSGTRDDDCIIYYWITGKENTLFACTFTIDKEQELSEENEMELNVIRQVIASIRIK